MKLNAALRWGEKATRRVDSLKADTTTQGRLIRNLENARLLDRRIYQDSTSRAVKVARRSGIWVGVKRGGIGTLLALAVLKVAFQFL